MSKKFILLSLRLVLYDTFQDWRNRYSSKRAKFKYYLSFCQLLKIYIHTLLASLCVGISVFNLLQDSKVCSSVFFFCFPQCCNLNILVLFWSLASSLLRCVVRMFYFCSTFEKIVVLLFVVCQQNIVFTINLVSPSLSSALHSLVVPPRSGCPRDMKFCIGS